MVHYHIQCDLCSVRRPYMNLFNFIVYYHNSKMKPDTDKHEKMKKKGNKKNVKIKEKKRMT